MQQVPHATAEFYQQQQRIAELTGRAVAEQWRRVGDDFDAGWAAVRDGTTQVVQAGMAASVRSAQEYTPALLAETRVAAPAAGRINASAFTSAAPDGSELASYFDAAPIRAKQAVSAGASSLRARSIAGAWLMSKVLTALADTRRDVVSTDMAQRPSLTGYVRMLNGPSCKDCVILAGKWFRWNEGFERHPNCDCVHIPATSQAWAEAEGFVSDPYDYFNSLTEAEQDRLFTRAGAQTIRDGGDIYRVVNIQNRGLGVSRQAVKYGTPTRMRPQDIYDLGLSRERTIEMLTREGYITGPQVGGGNIVGRYREAFQTPISRPIVAGSNRDRVLRARETGVRDPLDRATMTAQERRLFDAVYQREYARKYGYLPRTIGQNSADLYSGLVGRAATAERLAMLDAQISRQLAKIRPSQRSMLLLVDELGLNADEFATGQVFRAIENRIGTAAIARTQTGASGGGGRIPPSTRRAAGMPDEPDFNTPEGKRYWRARQDALPTNRISDALEPHEIRFYEQFTEAHRVRLIPKSGTGVPTNDFAWVSRDDLLVEVKTTKARARTINARISEAVTKAQARGVVKENFIVDLGQQPLTEVLVNQLSRYNSGRIPERRIARLWVFSNGELTEIPLKTVK